MKRLKKKCIKALMRLFTFVGSFALKKKNIVLLANGLKSYDGNTKYIYEYFEKIKNIDNKFEYYWVTDNKDEYERLKKNGKKIIYSYSLKGIVKIIEASVYIVTIGKNDILDGLYINKKSTIIQTWHGTPIKTLGKRANKYYSLKEIDKQIKGCFPDNAYVLSGSVFIEEIFKECFNVSKDKFLKFGYPRNDLFKQDYNEENKYKILGEKLNNKIVLYCPTWRENEEFKLFPFEDGNLFDLNKFLEDNNMVLLIKLHPLHQNRNLINNNFTNIKLIDNKISLDTQELLQVTDILLTDYSSIYFDFILMNKPVIFIPYDYEQYCRGRDFLYSYDENTPGAKVKCFNDLKIELKKANSKYYEKERRFINVKFNEYNKFNSCKQILDFIIKILEKK